jgi:hypothetical protein
LLVLKGCIDLPLLYFGSLFCHCLEISSPFCRILEYHDPESIFMYENLARATENNFSVYSKIKYDLHDRPHILLYEYVPSLLLHEFGIERANFILGSDNISHSKIMQGIGRILALDLFFNNYDRISWLWNNEGNSNNLLFKVDIDKLKEPKNFKDIKNFDIIIDEVISIDTKPLCLNPNDPLSFKKLEIYCKGLREKLNLFFLEIEIIVLSENYPQLKEEDFESFSFDSMKVLYDFFYYSSGCKLSKYSLFKIATAFVSNLWIISNINEEDIFQLIKYIQFKSIVQDWDKIFDSYAKLLNMDYFKYMLLFLKEITKKYSTIVEKIIEKQKENNIYSFGENLQQVIKTQDNLKYHNKTTDHHQSEVIQKLIQVLDSTKTNIVDT